MSLKAQTSTQKVGTTKIKVNFKEKITTEIKTLSKTELADYNNNDDVQKQDQSLDTSFFSEGIPRLMLLVPFIYLVYSLFPNSNRIFTYGVVNMTSLIPRTLNNLKQITLDESFKVEETTLKYYIKNNENGREIILEIKDRKITLAKINLKEGFFSFFDAEVYLTGGREKLASETRNKELNKDLSKIEKGFIICYEEGEKHLIEILRDLKSLKLEKQGPASGGDIFVTTIREIGTQLLKRLAGTIIIEKKIKESLLSFSNTAYVTSSSCEEGVKRFERKLHSYLSKYSGGDSDRLWKFINDEVEYVLVKEPADLKSKKFFMTIGSEKNLNKKEEGFLISNLAERIKNSHKQNSDLEEVFFSRLLTHLSGFFRHENHHKSYGLEGQTVEDLKESRKISFDHHNKTTQYSYNNHSIENRYNFHAGQTHDLYYSKVLYLFKMFEVFFESKSNLREPTKEEITQNIIVSAIGVSAIDRDVLIDKNCKYWVPYKEYQLDQNKELFPYYSTYTGSNFIQALLTNPWEGSNRIPLFNLFRAFSETVKLSPTLSCKNLESFKDNLVKSTIIIGGLQYETHSINLRDIKGLGDTTLKSMPQNIETVTLFKFYDTEQKQIKNYGYSDNSLPSILNLAEPENNLKMNYCSFSSKYQEKEYRKSSLKYLSLAEGSKTYQTFKDIIQKDNLVFERQTKREDQKKYNKIPLLAQISHYGSSYLSIHPYFYGYKAKSTINSNWSAAFLENINLKIRDYSTRYINSPGQYAINSNDYIKDNTEFTKKILESNKTKFEIETNVENATIKVVNSETKSILINPITNDNSLYHEGVKQQISFNYKKEEPKKVKYLYEESSNLNTHIKDNLKYFNNRTQHCIEELRKCTLKKGLYDYLYEGYDEKNNEKDSLVDAFHYYYKAKLISKLDEGNKKEIKSDFKIRDYRYSVNKSALIFLKEKYQSLVTRLKYINLNSSELVKGEKYSSSKKDEIYDRNFAREVMDHQIYSNLSTTLETYLIAYKGLVFPFMDPLTEPLKIPLVRDSEVFYKKDQYQKVLTNCEKKSRSTITNRTKLPNLNTKNPSAGDLKKNWPDMGIHKFFSKPLSFKLTEEDDYYKGRTFVDKYDADYRGNIILKTPCESFNPQITLYCNSVLSIGIGEKIDWTVEDNIVEKAEKHYSHAISKITTFSETKNTFKYSLREEVNPDFEKLLLFKEKDFTEYYNNGADTKVPYKIDKKLISRAFISLMNTNGDILLPWEALIILNNKLNNMIEDFEDNVELKNHVEQLSRMIFYQILSNTQKIKDSSQFDQSYKQQKAALIKALSVPSLKFLKEGTSELININGFATTLPFTILKGTLIEKGNTKPIDTIYFMDYQIREARCLNSSKIYSESADLILEDFNSIFNDTRIKKGLWDYKEGITINKNNTFSFRYSKADAYLGRLIGVPKDTLTSTYVYNLLFTSEVTALVRTSQDTSKNLLGDLKARMTR